MTRHLRKAEGVTRRSGLRTRWRFKDKVSGGRAAALKGGRREPRNEPRGSSWWGSPGCYGG